MLHYINYADHKFYYQQSYLLNKYESYGFLSDQYTHCKIDQNFVKENKQTLSSERGAGYWLWKPYIILDKLFKINNGDIVFYTDCGDYPKKDISELLINTIKENNYFIIHNVYNNYQYTKKDCFELMNCDSNEYYISKHVEAGVCGFIKNEETIKFVIEWLNYCKNYEIINDNYKSSNQDGFIDHRHDQSILTNLVVKHKIKTIDISLIDEYISIGSIK